MSQIIRDKITCAQFVSALSDRFVSRILQLEGITSLREAIVRAKTIKLIQENNFEQRRKNVNFEGRRENRNNDNFSGNFNREIAKRVSKVILKGMRESLKKLSLEKVKIMGEKELEIERSAGSVRKRGNSGRSVRASRKTRSRALWGKLGWNWEIPATCLFC